MRRTVIRIIDGDTFIVNRKIGDTNKIRLANVNAPEKYKFGGRRAANLLRELIGKKQVTIIPLAKSYDRIVADVKVDGKSVNKIMKRKLRIYFN